MRKTAREMLKAFWKVWTRLAHKIGDFQARILLTVIYAVLVLPFGFIVRFFADPLHIKKRPSQWFDRAPEVHDMNWAQKQ
jgi:hypothetical protein